MRSLNPTTRRRAVARGFTITELLVAVGVMVVITGVILVRYGSFNSAVLLRSQAYEVALAIRQAQSLAAAARGDDGDFDGRYGIHFDLTTPNTYLIFQDADGDGTYDPGSDAIYGAPGVVDDRFEIRGFRDADDGGGSSVLDGSETALSITFERPNFDARFNDDAVTAPLVYIEVAVAGETGGENDVLRTIEVTRAGQISVQ